ncbi:hypothetical protein NOCA2330026 [metagenome]|uniref:Uncharacterized protein n=1 Tax=metagenome TaxID=256318 RepID=A0A2P2C698_9ZZZZ
MGGRTVMNDSTVYTIGTALSRAKDQDLPVEVLVEGQWLNGKVSASDGHGLVLTNDAREQSVVRMASISAVRVLSAAKTRPQPAYQESYEPSWAARQSGGTPATVHPMPGPRHEPVDCHESVLAIAGSSN